jgi:BirA family biotin operon repressor/biotin-[acetyl-CoA-carboxylase] ligase
MVKPELSVSAIKEGLTTRFIGREISYYPVVPSTMDAARQEARRGAPEGTVILAGEQTRGRGRRSRTWYSPGGNIALSIILYPEPAALPFLIMIASLAVARSIESATGLKTQIKWPNDIFVRGKKVAGILIESELKGEKLAYAIAGIGINVVLQTTRIREIAATATSLEAAAGRKISREGVIMDLLREFERWYLELPDTKPVFKAWRDRLITLGQKVKVMWNTETLEGTAESVDESGALLLRRADGALTKIVAGDVTLRS